MRRDGLEYNAGKKVSSALCHAGVKSPYDDPTTERTTFSMEVSSGGVGLPAVPWDLLIASDILIGY